MSDWQDIETAPRDGTPIQAEIPGHGQDNVIAWQGGFYDSDDKPCGAWVFMEDREPPGCWTDGVCWTVNEDLVPSVKPTRWKHLQSATEASDDQLP